MALDTRIDVDIKIHPSWHRITRELGDIIQLSSRNVEKDAKRLCPVDTGATRNSIFIHEEGSITRGEVNYRIGPTTEYAPALELGRGASGSSAQPFMVPALKSEKPRLLSAITQALKKLQ